MKTSRWVGSAAVVAALSLAGWWFFVRVAEPEQTFRTAKIERGSLQAAVSATGTVTPVRQVQISSQVSGQIKELFVDFNSEVKEGQLIARLDPETFEYRVRQSTADVEAARASVLTAQANVQSALAQVARANGDVGEAQRDEKRKQDLLVQNFISPAELDTAKARTESLLQSAKVAVAQVAVARAQEQNAVAIVKQRDAQLQQARVDLERTQIRSPVDGVVIKRSVEVGQTVAASLQAPELFVIARNLSDMQVEASIDESDISRVRDGQKVSFSIDAFPGRSFDGAVRQVRKAAVSAQNVVSYTVVVGFANPGSLMLPGMTANVRIITDTRDNVLKVPNAALRVRIAGIEPATAAASGAAAGAAPGAAATTAPPPAAASAVRTGAAHSWSLWPQALAQGAPGGRLAAMRERLVEGLQLDAAQQTKLDAVLGDMRADFAALRDLPEEQRAPMRDKLMLEMRRRVHAFLTPAQREAYAQLQAQAAAQGAQAGAAAPTAAARPAEATGSAAVAGKGAGQVAGQGAAQRAAAGATAGATGSTPTAAATGATGGATAAATAGAAPARAAAAAPAQAQPPDVPASGPLVEFRRRLIDELALTPAQTAQVDTVIAAQRPRFADLRSLAEGQRGKARDRILADMRALIGEQLTPEQLPRYQKLLAEMAGRQNTRGRIYLLAEGGKPVAYNVRLGISDGVMTELIVGPNSPDADVLVEGATVITAVIAPAAGGSGARPAATPPAAPPRFF